MRDQASDRGRIRPSRSPVREQVPKERKRRLAAVRADGGEQVGQVDGFAKELLDPPQFLIA